MKMETSTVGMLYLVSIKLTRKATNEKIKQRLLVVGCEVDDIERKLRWTIDTSKYDSFMVTGIEKIRQKVHVLSTSVQQIDEGLDGPVITQGDGTKIVDQTVDTVKRPRFAVGLATQVIAVDEDAALRKVGHALISHTLGDITSSGASLSADSVLTIEELAPRDGTARARDVSNESNYAHIFRG
jgi:hypothetical protein